MAKQLLGSCQPEFWPGFGAKINLQDKGVVWGQDLGLGRVRINLSSFKVKKRKENTIPLHLMLCSSPVLEKR